MLSRFFSTSQSIPTRSYDLVVIGSSRAAISCAIDSVKRGKKVALVDRKDHFGGGCVHSGMILPCKTFREAVLHSTSYRHRGLYGRSYGLSKGKATVSALLERVSIVRELEMNSIRAQLFAADVELISGNAKFQSSHDLLISGVEYKGNTGSNQQLRVNAQNFLLDCGTRPAPCSFVQLDGKKCFDSDQILSGNLKTIPKSLIVVGAGVVGFEFASTFNVIPGCNVTVIDINKEILTFADKEITSALLHEMRVSGARFLLGEKITSVEDHPMGVKVLLDSGKSVVGDVLLYTVGRQAATKFLSLESAGLCLDERNLVAVNSKYQTQQAHIYAAGDCIGPPGLPSTSQEQGRLVSCYMWDKNFASVDQSQLNNGNYPYSIYGIPEISMVGATEQQLTKHGINFGVGIANYSELAKGQMLGGEQEGFLKLLFDQSTLKILGVHAMGYAATEIIHIGQVAMAMNCEISYFRDAVLNYPTLAEAYRVAALNGLGGL